MKRGIHKEPDGWLLCYDGSALEPHVYPSLVAAQLAWNAARRTGGEFDELLASERKFDNL